MKRKQFNEKHGMGHLEKEKRAEYFERLIKPYEKKGVKEYFIMQYLDGDGNELNEKFWSVHSSSRFAFELYSWMANCSLIKDICFEKKLTGLNETKRSPNMDVYIELDDRIIFIESKFSESSSQKIDSLSPAYDKEKGKAETNHGLVGKLELIERYYGHDDASEAFPKFIESVRSNLDCKYKPCWMDYKQEITHLVGIYLTIANDSTNYYKNKNIEFYNVYYDFEDQPNSPVEWFFKKASDLMNNLLVKNGLCKTFKYEHLSAQSLANSNVIIKFDKSVSAYGLSNRTIGEQLKDEFDLIIK